MSSKVGRKKSPEKGWPAKELLQELNDVEESKEMDIISQILERPFNQDTLADNLVIGYYHTAWQYAKKFNLEQSAAYLGISKQLLENIQDANQDYTALVNETKQILRPYANQPEFMESVLSFLTGILQHYKLYKHAFTIAQEQEDLITMQSLEFPLYVPSLSESITLEQHELQIREREIAQEQTVVEEVKKHVGNNNLLDLFELLEPQAIKSTIVDAIRDMFLSLNGEFEGLLVEQQARILKSANVAK